MRPIDADALHAKIYEDSERSYGASANIAQVLLRIETAPTLDYAPVVRCEKCKHAHRTGVKDVYFCDPFECECDHDFYCKDGEERKPK